MKKSAKIILPIAALVVLQMILFVRKRQQTRERTKYILYEVAEAGYETAEDILFPSKSPRISRRYRQ